MSKQALRERPRTHCRRDLGSGSGASCLVKCSCTHACGRRKYQRELGNSGMEEEGGRTVEARMTRAERKVLLDRVVDENSKDGEPLRQAVKDRLDRHNPSPLTPWAAPAHWALATELPARHEWPATLSKAAAGNAHWACALRPGRISLGQIYLPVARMLLMSAVLDASARVCAAIPCMHVHQLRASGAARPLRALPRSVSISVQPQAQCSTALE